MNMLVLMMRMVMIMKTGQEMREEAFRRVGSDSATIEGQITAAERWFYEDDDDKDDDVDDNNDDDKDKDDDVDGDSATIEGQITAA